MYYLIKIPIIVVLFIGLTICLTSCKKKPTPPIVTTTNVSDIAQTTATTRGNVTSDGNAEVTSRGVCWNTSENPTVGNKKTSDGSGTGPFASSLTQLIPNTKYYVKAYANNSAGTGYGNQVSFITGQIIVPTLTTTTVTSVTETTAVSGGSITADGGGTITSRGVCWATIANPTITDSKTVDGQGTGNFTSNIIGLLPGTAYHLRAYATNSAGTAYGNDLTFTSEAVKTLTDIDGNIYHYITIGNQIWMTENLKTTKYRNGDPILTGLSGVDWSSTTSGAYAIYNNDNLNNDTYGKLYNWYAVADSRHLCPADWHEPSNAEWTILETYLANNGYGFGGEGNDIAKSMAATSGWNESNLAGSVGNDQTNNNSSGFTALPGGFIHSHGLFDFIGYIGFWWSSSEGESGSNNAWSRYLQNNSSDLNNIQYIKNKGLSVRCIKD
jgi:uncharacterized protein (TIGR02145 family)